MHNRVAFPVARLDARKDHLAIRIGPSRAACVGIGVDSDILSNIVVSTWARSGVPKHE